VLVKVKEMVMEMDLVKVKDLVRFLEKVKFQAEQAFGLVLLLPADL